MWSNVKKQEKLKRNVTNKPFSTDFLSVLAANSGFLVKFATKNKTDGKDSTY